MSQKVLKVEDLRRIINARLADNLDSVLAVTGGRGLGKSTFLYALASTNDSRFSLEKNFVFRRGLAHFQAKHGALNKGEVLAIDEANRNFSVRRFMDTQQVDLYRFIQASRKKNLCLAFASPDFSALGRDLIMLCDLWVFVVARGQGVLFRARGSPVSNDRFKLKASAEIWEKETADLSPSELTVEKQLQILSTFPCFAGFVIWPKMPEDAEKRYLELDAAGKEADAAALEPEKPVEKRKKRDLNFIRFGRLAAWVSRERRGTIKEIRIASKCAIGDLIEALRLARQEREGIGPDSIAAELEAQTPEPLEPKDAGQVAENSPASS